MNDRFADYGNSILNLSCSILRAYGCGCRHPTLPAADKLLDKGFKNVVLLLFDGLGTDALEHHLPEGSFLRRHQISRISSVFPPTTTAATTSVISGLSPAEHGWLGWRLYFSELDDNIDLFPNTGSDGKAIQRHAANTYLPYKNIMQTINESGKARAVSLRSFGADGYKSRRGMRRKILGLCKERGGHFIYCYDSQPDALMHATGCYSEKTRREIIRINRAVQKLCARLKNTLVMVTADHGLIDAADSRCILDYPKLVDTLERLPSMEPRVLNCFVKNGRDADFIAECGNAFGDDVLIVSKAQAIESGIFGDTESNAILDKRLGDYLLIPVTAMAIHNTYASARKFIGVHAGVDKRELEVPLIAVET